MKAISKTKYKNLKGAIEELQCLLAMSFPENAFVELNRELATKKEAIEKLFRMYSCLLDQLENITTDYDELMLEIKNNLLSKSLKELKTTVHPASNAYLHFHTSVQLLRGA